MQRPILVRRSGAGHVNRLVVRLLASSSKPDHYKTLGLKRDAKQKDVKEAFYRLSKQFHPDVNSDEVALQKFQDITAAYETLGTEESRNQYDISTQPSKQRINAAPPTTAATASADQDYTEFYRLRKRANERIRVKMHSTGGRTGSAAAGFTPGRRMANHYESGNFDEDKLRGMTHDVLTRNESEIVRTFEDVNFNGAIGLFAALGALIIVFYALTKEVHIMKGHRILLKIDEGKEK